MNTQKDPDITKLLTLTARLEKVVAALVVRVQTLERENKRLKGAVRRTTDHVGTVERRLPR